MSRQQGKRDRPAPERKAFQEKHRRPSKERRRQSATPLTGRPQWEAPISNGRRWAAVAGGTIAALLAFGLVAAAIVQAADGNDSGATLAAVAAALTIPLLLLVIGFISRAASPWRTAGVWSAVVVALFVAGSFAASEPATGFVLAVATGTVMALRFEEGVHRRSWRMWTAIGLAVYTKAVYLLSPGLAITAAPLLPVAGVAVIDSVAERRAVDGQATDTPR